jgi:hypothetical protein
VTALLARDVPPCEFASVADVREACDQVRLRLGEAAMRGDIPAICGCRAAAEDIRVAVRDAHLGPEARLAAAELQRRGDRTLGVALRAGQAAGTIQTRGGHSLDALGIPCATDYVSRNDLYPGGNGRSAGIYNLADGITDEAFEAALAAGRAQGVLSRVSVARRLGFDHVVIPDGGRRPAVPDYPDAPDPGDRSFAAIGQRLGVIRGMAAGGHTSRQIADAIGRSEPYVRDLIRREAIVIPADEVTRKNHGRDSDQIVQGTVAALEGLAMGVEFVDPADLDPALIHGWVTSLTRTTRAINRLKRDLQKMKEITQ